MDYAAEQLGHFLPALAPVVGGVARILPQRLSGFAWPLPIGAVPATGSVRRISVKCIRLLVRILPCFTYLQ